MAAATSRKLFVNLGVRDLEASIEFFSELGFAFDPRFTDESATCMILSEEAFVMLLVEDRFKGFTWKALCDAGTHTEAILAISAESREQVDALVDTALDCGGRPANEPMDHGFMYGRSFQDVDGHLWEVIWIGPGRAARPGLGAPAGAQRDLELDRSGDAGDRAAADPDRAARVGRDVHAAGAAEDRALAGDVGRAARGRCRAATAQGRR